MEHKSQLYSSWGTVWKCLAGNYSCTEVVNGETLGSRTHGRFGSIEALPIGQDSGFFIELLRNPKQDRLGSTCLYSQNSGDTNRQITVSQSQPCLYGKSLSQPGLQSETLSLKQETNKQTKITKPWETIGSFYDLLFLNVITFFNTDPAIVIPSTMKSSQSWANDLPLNIQNYEINTPLYK